MIARLIHYREKLKARRRREESASRDRKIRAISSGERSTIRLKCARDEEDEPGPSQFAESRRQNRPGDGGGGGGRGGLRWNAVVRFNDLELRP